MTSRSTRTLLRTVHLALGLSVGAVIYMPPAWSEPLRLALGIVAVPAIVLTGIWMWQQARLRKLLSLRGRATGRPAGQAPGRGTARGTT